MTPQRKKKPIWHFIFACVGFLLLCLFLAVEIYEVWKKLHTVDPLDIGLFAICAFGFYVCLLWIRLLIKRRREENEQSERFKQDI